MSCSADVRSARKHLRPASTTAAKEGAAHLPLRGMQRQSTTIGVKVIMVMVRGWTAEAATGEPGAVFVSRTERMGHYGSDTGEAVRAPSPP